MGGDGQGESHVEGDPWVKTWRRWGNVWYRSLGEGQKKERKSQVTSIGVPLYYELPPWTVKFSSNSGPLFQGVHYPSLITMKHTHLSRSSKQMCRRTVLCGDHREPSFRTLLIFHLSAGCPEDHSLWSPGRNSSRCCVALQETVFILFHCWKAFLVAFPYF